MPMAGVLAHEKWAELCKARGLPHEFVVRGVDRMMMRDAYVVCETYF